METTTARHTWVPYVAGLSGACLLLMATANLGTREQIETPAVVLYLSGLALAAGAAVGEGLRHERVAVRFGVAAGLVALLAAWVVMIGDLLSPIFEIFSDQEYVNDNAPIAILGVILLAAAYRGFAHDRSAPPQRTRAT